MSLIYQYKDVIASGEHGIFLGLVILEFMDERKDHRLVARQKLSELYGILRLAFFLIAHHLRAHKCLMYLRIQVIPIRDHQEGEIAMQLALHLSYKHHHRIALARTLCMPKDTKLTLQLLPALHGFHQIVHAEILVVLGDNFDALVIEEHEVLNIVQEALLAEETIYQGLNTQSMFGDLLPVQFLLFVIHPEPFEEELIACIPCTELGLQTVAQHADLVHGKDVRYVLAIRNEVLVVRFLYLDGGVFQFDKHHG